ncbi:MAG: precorrin-3B synthase [Pseudolabrys sp.]
MTATLRRGWCPSLAVPMATGDGLLARLPPPGRTIGLNTFKSLCAAARAHGNGIVEVTARGSLQVRGLDDESTVRFAAEVALLGIDGGDGPVLLAHPLSGLEAGEYADMLPLATDLRAALAAAPFVSRLAAKVSVVLDGADALHLDALNADLRLRAVSADGRVIFHIALGGNGTNAVPLGAVAPEQAAACVLCLLEQLSMDAPGGRMRDLVREGGVRPLRAALAGLLIEIPAPPVRPAAQWIGTHRLRSGQVAVGLGLPFGHADASALMSLTDAAVVAGAAGFRTAPQRVLLAVELAPNAVAGFTAAAETLGFITGPTDPRRRIVACPGAPVCGSGEIPARALAPAVTQAIGDTLPGGALVHLSGCAKGCAHPGPAFLTVAGRDGTCDVLIDGRLQASVSPDELPERLAQLVAMAEVE